MLPTPAPPPFSQQTDIRRDLLESQSSPILLGSRGKNHAKKQQELGMRPNSLLGCGDS